MGSEDTMIKPYHSRFSSAVALAKADDRPAGGVTERGSAEMVCTERAGPEP
jgi:hypothetical protein